MRNLIFAIFISSTFTLGTHSAYLFKNQGLQEWYQKLHNFEDVDLDSPLLKDCNESDRQFAMMQYHWQAMLRGDQDTTHYNTLKRLSKQSLPEDYSRDQQLLNKVLSSFFLARASSLKGESLSSLSSYLGASEAMESLMNLKTKGEEVGLLSTIYSLGYQEFSSNPLYWTISAWLPKPKQQAKKKDLIEFTSSSSAIISAEASYYAYRMYWEKDADLAQKHLQSLIRRFPRNWIYRLEYYKSFSRKTKEGDKLKKELLTALETAVYLSKKEKKHFTEVLNSL